jgi:hypothetical protein
MSSNRAGMKAAASGFATSRADVHLEADQASQVQNLGNVCLIDAQHRMELAVCDIPGEVPVTGPRLLAVREPNAARQLLGTPEDEQGLMADHT